MSHVTDEMYGIVDEVPRRDVVCLSIMARQLDDLRRRVDELEGAKAVPYKSRGRAEIERLFVATRVRSEMR